MIYLVNVNMILVDILLLMVKKKLLMTIEKMVNNKILVFSKNDSTFMITEKYILLILILEKMIGLIIYKLLQLKIKRMAFYFSNSQLKIFLFLLFLEHLA